MDKPSDIAAALSDPRVTQLKSQAGTEGALTRSKWLAAGIVLVGMLGAMGVALRPIYVAEFARRAQARGPQRSADKARRALAHSAGEALPAAEAEQLSMLLARLRDLQLAHRVRHPLWYGEPERGAKLAIPGSDLDGASRARDADIPQQLR